MRKKILALCLAAVMAARSLDTLALLIQEQLRAIGIDSELHVEEGSSGKILGQPENEYTELLLKSLILL